MCGIAGYIKKGTTYIPNANDIVKDMVYFNRLRGVDALGIFKTSKFSNNPIKLESVKAVGDPYRLITADKKFEEILKYPGDVRYLVTHNRLATRGEKNEICAQPFVAPKPTKGKGCIVLVHNGTLTHINKEDEFPGRTDSHQIAKMIASGMSLAEFEARVWGSFALVWYDEDEDTLNLLRNAERPLGLIETSEGFFFGSEPYLIAGAIARRNGGTVQQITNLKSMDHWAYHYEDKKWETTKVKPAKKEITSQSSIPPWEGEFDGGNSNLLDCDLSGGANGNCTPIRSGSSSGSPIVKPFNAPDYGTGAGGQQGILLVDKNGNIRRSRPSWAEEAGRKSVGRFKSAVEALGHSTGDTLRFSITSCHQTRRTSQLVVEGFAVIDGMEGPTNITILPRMYIYGMIGGKTSADIRNKGNLWKGIISDIKRTDKPVTQYKMMLKDIEEEQTFDIFRAGHRLKGILSIGETIPPARKAEEREFADTPIEQEAKKWVQSLVAHEDHPKANTGGPSFFTCDNCRQVHPPGTFQTYKKIFGYEDIEISLRACNTCNNLFVKDQGLLMALFESKRQKLMKLIPPAGSETSQIIH